MGVFLVFIVCDVFYFLCVVVVGGCWSGWLCKIIIWKWLFSGSGCSGCSCGLNFMCGEVVCRVWRNDVGVVGEIELRYGIV